MKILIIHTAFIGDIVLSTPLIDRIKEKYPESKITYVTTKLGASILRNNPNLTEIIEYDKRGEHKGIKGVIQLGKRLRYENFDLVITPHRYLRSSILSWLTRAPKIVGYDNAAGKILFTDKVHYDKKNHEVEKLLSFLGKDLVGDLKEKYPIKIFPGKKEIEKIDKILKKNEKKKIVIAPGSKWFTKKWPLEYFNKIIKLNKQNDKELIIVGGDEEKLLNIDLQENVIDLRGKTSLLELAEVIRRADVVLTNDSSPIHIASAYKNVHIIALFGPTVEEFGFFPWSKNSEVLENKSLVCRPCSLHGGNSCPKGHFECMLKITPEVVNERIQKALVE